MGASSLHTCFYRWLSRAPHAALKLLIVGKPFCLRRFKRRQGLVNWLESHGAGDHAHAAVWTRKCDEQVSEDALANYFAHSTRPIGKEAEVPICPHPGCTQACAFRTPWSSFHSSSREVVQRDIWSYGKQASTIATVAALFCTAL